MSVEKVINIIRHECCDRCKADTWCDTCNVERAVQKIVESTLGSTRLSQLQGKELMIRKEI